MSPATRRATHYHHNIIITRRAQGQPPRRSPAPFNQTNRNTMKHPFFNVEMFEDGKAAQTLAQVFTISELARYIRFATYGETVCSEELSHYSPTENGAIIAVVNLNAARDIIDVLTDAIDNAERTNNLSEQEKIEAIQKGLNIQERAALQRTIRKGIYYFNIDIDQLDECDELFGMEWHEILLKAAKMTDEERAALEANAND